jgi:hypothetical protein
VKTNYKLSVFYSGAETQHFYSRNCGKLVERAVKEMQDPETLRRWARAACFPVRADVYELKASRRRCRLSDWTLLHTVLPLKG